MVVGWIVLATVPLAMVLWATRRVRGSENGKR